VAVGVVVVLEMVDVEEGDVVAVALAYEQRYA
jgi:hypothetical protein